MTLPHLYLTPDAGVYEEKEDSEIVGVSLTSGASLIRRDKVNGSHFANVQWSMTPEQYRYFRAFYNTALVRGTLPFTCNLLSEDGGGATERVCSFVPGSLSMPAQVGLTFIQTASLEIRPLKPDPYVEAWVLAFFDAGYDNTWPDRISHLINVTGAETFNA